MNHKNQRKLINLERVTIVGLFLAAFFLLEPILRDRLTFAFTYLDRPQVSGDSIKTDFYAEPSTVATTPQKSHAPEPSSLLLILSGIGGIIVRFARKRFEEFKRVMDMVLSVAGLTITFPVLIFVALLIKLESRGPVIYRQKRVGKGGKIFKIYKLRTMRLDAEKYTGAVWAKENDPRITSVGRVLRKLHLDEIPQLFNVIKDQMSIVGPRPERPEMVRDLKVVIHDYEKRLKVKPGITGLAQVHHKYDETIADVRKKIKYDLLYIKKMCWLVEMRILARTFVVALTGKGAR